MDQARILAKRHVSAPMEPVLDQLAPSLRSQQPVKCLPLERLVQVQRLAALVRGIAEPDDLIAVGGDFNVEPDSDTFVVLAELGLVDLVSRDGYSGTRSTHYTKPGRFADYILVNDQVPIEAFSVVTTLEVSDHCPLVLELKRTAVAR